jgi:hypothetical protein
MTKKKPKVITEQPGYLIEDARTNSTAHVEMDNTAWTTTRAEMLTLGIKTASHADLATLAATA